MLKQVVEEVVEEDISIISIVQTQSGLIVVKPKAFEAEQTIRNRLGVIKIPIL